MASVDLLTVVGPRRHLQGLLDAYNGHAVEGARQKAWEDVAGALDDEALARADSAYPLCVTCADRGCAECAPAIPAGAVPVRWLGGTPAAGGGVLGSNSAPVRRPCPMLAELMEHM
jgi:hypothetical protein